MTKASSRVAARPRRSNQSRSTLTWIAVLGGGAVATIALIVVLLAPRPIPTLDGVQVYPSQSGSHSEAPQTYPQTPPVGGVHSAQWQNCGIYDQPVQNEKAVHSLEHGAVWIAYRPDLAAADVETLRSLARGRSHVLLSPYPDLPSPVVATAWGLQLPTDSVGDARLLLFIQRYAQGPQTPEPGAACTGGVGTPIG
jgi:hypothetical protein